MDAFNMDEDKERTNDDGLFMERLEMLYEQGLNDLRSFSERENRPFHEVKQRMAELHCKSLFNDTSSQPFSSDTKKLVNSVLHCISQQLESLETLAGLQSFLLVVNPNDQGDEGFLGGTVTGREFWRGHRGCGAPGAQAFKAHSGRARGEPVRTSTPPATGSPPPPLSTSSKRKGPARELKTELYAAVRDSLRAASGIRNAEMKWTNHSNLSVYGVRLIGWPNDVPMQNPSTLSVAQNRLVLEQLTTKKLYFVPIEGGAQAQEFTATASKEVTQREDDMIFEDSIDYSWVSGTSEVEESSCLLPSRDDMDRLSFPLPIHFSETQSNISSKDSPSTPSMSAISRDAIPKRRRIDDIE